MNLKESIISTLSYFDLFEYPLTKEELFRFLYTGGSKESISYPEFCERLEQLSLENKYGYYFLPGRESVVELRRQRLMYNEQKLRLAERAVKMIRSVPFLRAVFVCNSVGAGTAKYGSDVDFFIITAPNRIWLVRFFTNLILRLFGLRTYGNKSANRICLSFYTDTEHLDLSPWKIADDDIFLIYWLYQLVPIFDPNNWREKILSANLWTNIFLPNAASQLPEDYLNQVWPTSLSSGWQKVWEKMWQGAYGDLLEKQARDWQMMKLKFSIKEKANNNDKSVVLDKGVIKLHENDRREFYRKEWLEKLQHEKNN